MIKSTAIKLLNYDVPMHFLKHTKSHINVKYSKKDTYVGCKNLSVYDFLGLNFYFAQCFCSLYPWKRLLVSATNEKLFLTNNATTPVNIYSQNYISVIYHEQ